MVLTLQITQASVTVLRERQKPFVALKMVLLHIG